MEIHEIGQYSAPEGIVHIYMAQCPTYVDGGGNTIPAAVTYCMEAEAYNLMFVPDWLAFAHYVNGYIGDTVLDIDEDPAIELGLVVDVGLECPECACRVMDALVWVGEDLEEIQCTACNTIYIPGVP